MAKSFTDLIMQFMDTGNSTEHMDFRKPYVKPSLRYVYPLFIFIHAFIAVVGK